MSATAWGVVVAIAAVLVGGVSVPVVLARRQRRAHTRTTLMPAYDELLQALGRLSDAGDRLSRGLSINLDERWDQDVAIVGDIERGKWPVTEPSDETRLLCKAIEMSTMTVKFAVKDRDKFASGDFDRAFRRAVDDNDSADLTRVLQGAIDDAVRLPSNGANFKQATDKLTAILKQRREKEIECS